MCGRFYVELKANGLCELCAVSLAETRFCVANSLPKSCPSGARMMGAE